MLSREGEVSALNIGTYLGCGHRFYEVMSAVLGPLLLDQLPKSKPCHPRVQLSGEPLGPAGPKPSLLVHATVPTRAGQLRFPGITPGATGGGHKNAPVGAGGGLNAPTGADRQGRGRSTPGPP